MGQKYAAYDSTGAIVAFYDSVDSPAPSGVSTIEITDDQWLECLATQGYTVSNGALVAAAEPSAADLLAMTQAAKIAEVYAAYQAAVQVSVEYTTVAGVGKTYQADSASQNTLLIATTGYNLAGATPTGFYWVAEDNTQVPFTLDDLKGLYGVMLTQGNAAFNKLQALKASVRSATSASAVAAVAW
jgi:hypothetical protein